jgi:hypothetical protein
VVTTCLIVQMAVELAFSVATLKRSWGLLYGSESELGVALAFINYCSILIITAVEDIDLNRYFQKNEALAFCFCISRALDWSDIPIAALLQRKGTAELWPQAAWLGALPFLYALARFKSVLNQRKGFPRMTELWAMTWPLVFVVNGLMILAVITSNSMESGTVYMSTMMEAHFGPLNKMSDTARICLAVVAFLSAAITMYAYRKAKTLGLSFTVSLYMCIYAAYMCTGAYELIVLFIEYNIAPDDLSDRNWVSGLQVQPVYTV